MEILLFNCSWNNRGDESAFRAMVDEMKAVYPDIYFNIITHAEKGLMQFPYSERDKVKYTYIKNMTRRNIIDIPFLILSKGHIALFGNMRELIKTIKNTDIVFHAPGGPSMGDYYPRMQIPSYYKFFITMAFEKPYLFYAPSMGPFNKKLQNILRKKIFNGAQLITTREEYSAEYYNTLNAKKEITVTADSALQHEIDEEKYRKQFNEYSSLIGFLSNYEKTVGITITDLKWHKIYNNNNKIQNAIDISFKELINYLNNEGYGVVFIPQLFGEQNDYDLMIEYMQENCFIIDDRHDCYFQQYLISKLYAVVGLRYHSNVFSAKMKTPFISIAYEQKMSGFAKLCSMSDYCIDINNLCPEILIERFKLLERNHLSIKNHLQTVNHQLKQKSAQTTKLVCEFINNNL